MANNWIKWCAGLTQKPEVYGIARKLKIPRQEVAGRLMEVWEWADGNTENGQVDYVDASFIDGITSLAGFGDAMVGVGWLLVDDGGVIFPRFERNNGKSAKRRALEAERKARERAEGKGQNGDGGADG